MAGVARIPGIAGGVAAAALVGLALGAGAAPEQRCAELGADCVCSEPLHVQQSLFVPENVATRRFDPDDSDVATQCEGEAADGAAVTLDASGSAVNPVCAGVPMPPGNTVSWVWRKDGGTLFRVQGDDVDVSNTTSCVRIYQRFADDFVAPETESNLNSIQAFSADNLVTSSGTTFAIQTNPSDPDGNPTFQLDDFSPYYDIDITGTSEPALRLQDCMDFWCRYETCVDHDAHGALNVRHRIVRLSTPPVSYSYAHRGGDADHSGAARPPLPRPSFVANQVDIGLLTDGLPQGRRYASHAMQGSRSPANESFWIGPAAEVEGGLGGPRPFTTELALSPDSGPAPLAFSLDAIPCENTGAVTCSADCDGDLVYETGPFDPAQPFVGCPALAGLGEHSVSVECTDAGTGQIRAATTGLLVRQPRPSLDVAPLSINTSAAVGAIGPAKFFGIANLSGEAGSTLNYQVDVLDPSDCDPDGDPLTSWLQISHTSGALAQGAPPAIVNVTFGGSNGCDEGEHGAVIRVSETVESGVPPVLIPVTLTTGSPPPLAGTTCTVNPSGADDAGIPCTGGQNYHSRQACVDAMPASLTGLGRHNCVVTSPGAIAENLVIDVGGTTPADYFTLTTSAAARHRGTPTSGAVLDPQAVGPAILVQADHTVVEYQRITGVEGEDDEGIRIAAEGVTLRNNVVHDLGPDNSDCIYGKEDAPNTRLENNVISGCERAGIHVAPQQAPGNQTQDWLIVNNTVVGNEYGLLWGCQPDDALTLRPSSNLFQDNAEGDVVETGEGNCPTPFASGDYNITSDALGNVPGANSRESVPLTDAACSGTCVRVGDLTGGAEDFRLVPDPDNAAIEGGSPVDSSTADIVGRPRVVSACRAPEVGAFELPEPLGFAVALDATPDGGLAPLSVILDVTPCENTGAITCNADCDGDLTYETGPFDASLPFAGCPALASSGAVGVGVECTDAGSGAIASDVDFVTVAQPLPSIDIMPTAVYASAAVGAAPAPGFFGLVNLNGDPGTTLNYQIDIVDPSDCNPGGSPLTSWLQVTPTSGSSPLGGAPQIISVSFPGASACDEGEHGALIRVSETVETGVPPVFVPVTLTTGSPPALSGTTCTVNPNGPDDAGTPCTGAQNYRTRQDCVDALPNSLTGLGRYNCLVTSPLTIAERVVIDVGGTTPNDYFTLTTSVAARHRGTSTSGAAIDPAGSGHALQVLADHTVVEYQRITGVEGESDEGIRVAANDVTIRNNVIHDLTPQNSDCIYAQDAVVEPEQRCVELGPACTCSEPIDNDDGGLFDEHNFSDSSPLTDCDTPNTNEPFLETPFNSANLRMVPETGMPPGNSVDQVLFADDVQSGWVDLYGNEGVPDPGVKRICTRWYNQVDDDWSGAAVNNIGCPSERNKVFDVDWVGTQGTANAWQLSEAQPVGCGGPGNYGPLKSAHNVYDSTRNIVDSQGAALTWDDCNVSSGWCRWEVCVHSPNGLDQGSESYASVRVVQLDTGKVFQTLDHGPFDYPGGLKTYHVNYFHGQGTGAIGGSYYSHFMQAAWNTDAAQWIGPAAEVEGPAPPPPGPAVQSIAIENNVLSSCERAAIHAAPYQQPGAQTQDWTLTNNTAVGSDFGLLYGCAPGDELFLRPTSNLFQDNSKGDIDEDPVSICSDPFAGGDYDITSDSQGNVPGANSLEAVPLTDAACSGACVRVADLGAGAEDFRLEPDPGNVALSGGSPTGSSATDIVGRPRVANACRAPEVGAFEFAEPEGLSLALAAEPPSGLAPLAVSLDVTTCESAGAVTCNADCDGDLVYETGPFDPALPFAGCPALPTPGAQSLGVECTDAGSGRVASGAAEVSVIQPLPGLDVLPASLSRSAAVGVDAAPTFFGVANVSGDPGTTLTYQVDVVDPSDCNPDGSPLTSWLQVSPTGGSLPQAGPTHVINLTFTGSGGCDEGEHGALIRVSESVLPGVPPVYVPVTLTVGSPPPLAGTTCTVNPSGPDDSGSTCTGGQNYHSRQACVDAMPASLTGLGPHNCLVTSPVAIAENLVIDVGGTTPTDSFTLTTSVAARHRGTSSSGAALDPAVTGHAIQVLSDHTVIEHQRITGVETEGDRGIRISASDVTIRNNVIHDLTTQDSDCIHARDDASGLVVENNVLSGCDRAGIYAGPQDQPGNQTQDWTITNNTIVGNDFGLLWGCAAGDSLTLRPFSNLIQQNVDTDVTDLGQGLCAPPFAAGDFNVVSDSTTPLPGPNELAGVPLTAFPCGGPCVRVQNAAPGSENFRLVADPNDVAIDAGSPADSTSADIVGRPRTAPDRGAFELP